MLTMVGCTLPLHISSNRVHALKSYLNLTKFRINNAELPDLQEHGRVKQLQVECVCFGSSGEPTHEAGTWASVDGYHADENLSSIQEEILVGVGHCDASMPWGGSLV
jgi:hypothetical protein